MGWFQWEGHISLGELTLAVTTGLSAWYVGSNLKRKQDRDAALRDLMRFFCRECLGLVSAASDVLEQEFARGGGGFDDVGRNNVRTALQRLSNSIHAVDEVIRRGSKLGGHEERQQCLHDLKNANESLREQILDPLMTVGKLNADHARQVQGAFVKVRDVVIALEIEVVSKLE